MVDDGAVGPAGVTISNSEVGHGSIRVSPFIYRLIYLNGMVVNASRLNSRHVTSPQASMDRVFEVLLDGAKEL